jgi:3-dehydroquinate synthase
VAQAQGSLTDDHLLRSRAMKRVRVRAGGRPYDVLIGRGVLSGQVLRAAVRGATSCFVMSSDRVMSLHGRALRRALNDAGIRAPHLHILRDGEAAKTAMEWQRTVGAMARAGLDRRALVVAFGGGSIGDAAGFAASTYVRGIPFLQIPTTLLSMVDSSVGGKTGINLPEGKNLVGAFHQPTLVVADTALLKTLPSREKQSGVYEILKCALLESPALLSTIRATSGLRRATKDQLEGAIAEAVRIKARIVSRDERESGDRILLNLGHTLGHALEAATDYRVFTHGEAVGYGMEFAADFGVDAGFTEPTVARAVREAVRSLGPRVPLRPEIARRLRHAMDRDKKREGDTLKEIFVVAPGRPSIRPVLVSDFAEGAALWVRREAGNETR